MRIELMLVIIIASMSAFCEGKLGLSSQNYPAEKADKGREEEQFYKATVLDKAKYIAVVRFLSPKSSIINIRFNSDFRAWILFDNGKLLSSHNEGASWEVINYKHVVGSLTNIFTTKNGEIWFALKNAPPLDSILCSEEFLFDHSGKAKNESLVIFRGQSIYLNKVIFTGKDEAWIGGARLTKSVPASSEFLLLETRNGGKSWIDHSHIVNKHSVAKYRGDNIVDMQAGDDKSILLLSSEGAIFKFDKSSESCQVIGIVPKEAEQTAYRKLQSFNNNKIAIVGGADSYEGVKGFISYYNTADGWHKFDLDGICLYDALWISESQVVACGSIISEGISGNFFDKREGLILTSKDKGKNWEILFKTPQIKTIYTLALSRDKSLWGGGDNGVLVHLSNYNIN